jgi:hypothetical protein
MVALPLLLIGWLLFRPELAFINSTVKDVAPANAALVSQGAFFSYAHETSGKAELLSVGDKNVLRLSGFRTSNGPAVRVYLVRATDPSDMNVKEKGFLDLGPIKGNLGDQNYELPADVDLSQYGAVSIWCARFGVNFGGASLARA